MENIGIAASRTAASATNHLPDSGQGGLTAKVAKNALWNWLGMGTEILVGILLMPFLIHRLGDTAYGTWIVIGSLTGYLGLLDFGLRSSVGRYVAFYHAQTDREGVRRVLNTSGFVLTLIGAMAFGMTVLGAQMLQLLVSVPDELLPVAQSAMVIVGVHLGLWIVLRIFDAALWGYERFDLLNIVDVPAAICRGVASATVVGTGFGLVGLAYVTLSLTLLVGIAKIVLFRMVDGDIRPSPAHISKETLRELLGYGVWNFLSGLATMARSQLTPVLVGSVLGLGMVAPFSIIVRLLNTATGLIGAGIGVLVPLATALHAQDDLARQRGLFLQTGRFCVAAALYFFALFACLGQPLLTLWVGPEFGWVWVPLVITAAGEILPMSAIMSENTILGMARNRSLASRSAAECATVLLLALPLSKYFGLNGLCVALAISATWWRGVFMLIRATELVELRVLQFATDSMLPVVKVAVLPVAALAAGCTWKAPGNWPMLIAYGALFSLVFAGCAGGTIVDLRLAWAAVRVRLQSQKSSPAVRPDTGFNPD